jgi:DNA-binding transcriptional LysR family regulator
VRGESPARAAPGCEQHAAGLSSAPVKFLGVSISLASGLLRLDLRQLAALLAVAETGTFSAAAQRLGYSQSAVSQQIAGLERTVGAALFVRPGGPRPVRPTPAGAALALHARAVFARLRAAQADISSLARGDRGTLRVGTLQSVGTRVLPRLIRRFREERPDVELTLFESHHLGDLADGVESGALDLSFTALPPPAGPFEVRRVLDDPLVFVAAADAPEASRRSIRIEEVAALPLIGVREPVLHATLLDRLQQGPHRPSFVFRSNDNPTIQGLIAAGLGYGLLPRLAVDDTDPQVVVVPLVPEVPPRRLAVLWHADRLPAPFAARFVDVAAEVCGAISSGWAGPGR